MATDLVETLVPRRFTVAMIWVPWLLLRGLTNETRIRCISWFSAVQ